MFNRHCKLYVIINNDINNTTTTTNNNNNNNNNNDDNNNIRNVIMVLVLDYTSLVYFDSEINLESVSLTNQF